jgi:formate dehydrogenase maturation protein FdhE
LSQITGVSNTEYTAKTTAAKESSSQKSESTSKEVEVKVTPNVSAGAGISTVSASTTDTLDYQTILAKANSGQQLTSAELAVLKEKNPTAYAKAMRTETARQELTSQMEKSPSQASSILNEALSSLSTKSDEESTTLVKALTAEYNSFISKRDQVIINDQVIVG